jgi:hypothetical protein
MKLRFVSYCIVTHALATATLFAADAAPATPEKPAQAERAPAVAANNAKSIPRSVFTVPTNPAEGRNPFFPKSTGGTASTKSPQTDTISLVVTGFGGTASKKLVMINNRTFEEGEEGEVTSGSLHTRIRCIEIKPDSDSAVIEIIGGERKEIRRRSAN